ncbi:MAG: hypothetical protein AAB214_07660 [Fibrobacterota bacterium]
MIRRALIPAALLLIATGSFAGLYLANTAVLVNEAKPTEFDLRTNGLLAHVCDTGFNVGIRIDLERISDKERLRIVIDPRLKAPVGTGRPARIPTDVVLQQLPPGSYIATKLVLGDRDAVPFKSDTFAIKSGSVTSLGKVKVRPETNFLGMMERITIKTDSVDIASRLKTVKAFGIDSMPVAPKKLGWIIEAP